MQGASQIKLTAGGGVASPHSPLDVATFTDARAPRRRRSCRELGHLCHRARVHARIDPALGRGRREGDRARPSDGRAHRTAAGRTGHLAQHPAASAGNGRRLSARFGGMAQVSGSTRRHGRRVQLCEEVQDQDGVRHRRPLLRGAREAAGSAPGQPDPLVHACGSARHGDRDQRRTAGALRQAQPLSRQARRRRGRRARRPPAGRRQPGREHQPHRRSRRATSWSS